MCGMFQYRHNPYIYIFIRVPTNCVTHRKKMTHQIDHLKRMTATERAVLHTITKKNCISKTCQHCKHSTTHEASKHHTLRYCNVCRVYVFRSVQDMLKKEYDEKMELIKNDNTRQEYIHTGRVHHVQPPLFEYLHLNTNTKFNSVHDSTPAAQKMYEELQLRRKYRIEQEVKVLTKLYPNVDRGELMQKLELVENNNEQPQFIRLSELDNSFYLYLHINKKEIFRSSKTTLDKAIEEYNNLEHWCSYM